MNFLPENYESPKTSNYYVKLQDGETRIRVLSTPIIGWEDWTLDKKPVRFKFENKPIKSLNPLKPVKHFWAFIVFNYNEEEIQVMNITQATIRKKIEALCKDSDWGAPYHYDIKITKSGSEINTEYVVNPTPHKPIDGYIVEMFKDRPCFLEAIFENKDPFSKEYANSTPMAVNNHSALNSPDLNSPNVGTISAKIKVDVVSESQAREIECILESCDPEYVKRCWINFKRLPVQMNSIKDLPVNLFERVKESALKNMHEYNNVENVEEFTLF